MVSHLGNHNYGSCFFGGLATSFATMLLFSVVIGTGIALIYPNLPKMIPYVFPPDLKSYKIILQICRKKFES